MTTYTITPSTSMQSNACCKCENYDSMCSTSFTSGTLVPTTVHNSGVNLYCVRCGRVVSAFRIIKGSHLRGES